ncbi:hypothetical protein L209DRAFT_113630 [Thermothelomyces heterothallicus CBS 203.75]
MNSARRPRPRSRQPPNAPRAQTQPPFVRVRDGSQEYTTPSGDLTTGAQHHQLFPVRSHETPAGFFADRSRFLVPDFQTTPPPAVRGATRAAADDSSVGRGGGGGGGGGKVAASAIPAAAKSKRVRTGCLTCRERHLKCDEGVPDCNNCRKSSRECRRGIRLNWIEMRKWDPPCLPQTAECPNPG